ncbi:hypothetical protein C8R45DRAFT_985337 [Mycena sanguinolenta]|nr:hypothetical protein C8R45DRAFT_985337 [Mycena sanguinolenta]
MLCVVIYLYTSSAIQWALDVWALFDDIHRMTMAPDVAIPDRGDSLEAKFAKFSGIQQALFMFNMLTGDAVVIWRLWAVYQRRIFAISIPCIMLLASLALALVDIFCTTYQGAGFEVNDMCIRTTLLAWPFSIITNVLCTILIGWKAWQHRKLTRELNVTGQSRTMSSGKILSILIESSLIYSLLWTMVYTLYRICHFNYVSEVVSRIANQLAGMYPTLIIVIVNLHRTIWDEPPTLREGSIRWAPNPSTSGLTDTFGTGHGVDLHLDAMVEIPVQNSICHLAVKEPPS